MNSTENREQAKKYPVRHEPHYNNAGKIVWETIEDKSLPSIPPGQPAKLPSLNREQRRLAHRYLRHKVNLRLARAQQRLDAKQYIRCLRCGLPSLGTSTLRCQCQAPKLHECAMCHRQYLASAQERRYANVCSECGRAIMAQHENEQASAGEAQRRLYAQREYDDEQHRLTQAAD